MTQSLNIAQKTVRAALALLGGAGLLTVAPWVAADTPLEETQLSDRDNGSECSSHGDCASRKCLQFVARDVKLAFSTFTHRGPKFCTPQDKACPTPSSARGTEAGKVYQSGSFGTLICKSDSEYINHKEARQLGQACGRDDCVFGQCRGSKVNGSGTRYCTEKGKCPKGGSPGAAPGTVSGTLECTAGGTWKLAPGASCFNRGLKGGKGVSSCASKKCVPSFNKKSYCLGDGYACSVPGKRGAKVGHRYKGGYVCTKRGWQR